MKNTGKQRKNKVGLRGSGAESRDFIVNSKAKENPQMTTTCALDSWPRVELVAQKFQTLCCVVRQKAVLLNFEPSPRPDDLRANFLQVCPSDHIPGG